MVALLRPDEFNHPLLLHVGGAMLLVGTLVAAAAALVQAIRVGPEEGAALARFGFRALLLGAIPAFVLMRVGAQWIASEEGLADSELAWIGIGYITSDAGAPLLILATVFASIMARRFARGEGRTGLAHVAPALTLLMVAAYLVAIWAMTMKPS